MKKYRDYQNAEKRVNDNYRKSRTFQTVDFVLKQREFFSKLCLQMDIWSILEDLNDLVDVSDPDCTFPNLHHAFQTAEMMRKDGLPDWFQLTGLIHDMGKIMYKRGTNENGTGKEEQWSMVGDTFIVGCALPDTLVYPEYNLYNLDQGNKLYNTKHGIYSANCGLDNLLCSWGHDEYLYQILTSPKNPNDLPEEALYCIRFHSLYPYHEKGEYKCFQSKKDEMYFPILKQFQSYDLYSKNDSSMEIDYLKPYYMNLIQKYFKNSYLFL